MQQDLQQKRVPDTKGVRYTLESGHYFLVAGASGAGAATEVLALPLR